MADLLDWKRRVFALYAEVRESADPRAARERWRASRDELFRSHPQSPIPAAERAAFPGVPYFDHDPSYRVLGEVAAMEPEHYDVTTSRDGTYGFSAFAEVRFELLGERHSLHALWLEGYGGGLFLSFRDATSGRETYGAGRYLLDTVKGADLGWEGGRLVLDFNFAYNPSCAYDPMWDCPLAPPSNRLAVPVRAGERSPHRD
ncbi:MAG: DUF1684 domain-containing protein [Actinobacteria bacterium]|nr:DUF1684 domain-containing protein [Actinomycetota bacterium]